MMMSPLRHALLLVVAASMLVNTSALSLLNKNANPSTSTTTSLSRRDAMTSAAFATAATVLATATPAVHAAAAAATQTKRTNISNEDLATVIRNDVAQNQFMVSADISRDVYDERATFTDEIDTYGMDQWITGTKRLFVAEKSHVDLVENSLQVSAQEASFRFTETLQFNIPILKPKMYLSGKVVFTRDAETGLITSYREQWDQDVKTVLAQAIYFSS
jgi:hypothetical protein